MKKIVLIIFIFCFIQKNEAQITHTNVVTDTSKYLRDSIIPKTNYYVGKSLSKLLKDLKVKVKSYTGLLPFDYLPDTLSFSETTFSFVLHKEVVSRINNDLLTPDLHIKFSNPIMIPKKYFKIGGFLVNPNWDSIKEAFFGNCIIASLEVRGLSPNKPPLLQNLLDTTDHH